MWSHEDHYFPVMVYLRMHFSIQKCAALELVLSVWADTKSDAVKEQLQPLISGALSYFSVN